MKTVNWLSVKFGNQNGGGFTMKVGSDGDDGTGERISEQQPRLRLLEDMTFFDGAAAINQEHAAAFEAARSAVE